MVLLTECVQSLKEKVGECGEVDPNLTEAHSDRHSLYVGNVHCACIHFLFTAALLNPC